MRDLQDRFNQGRFVERALDEGYQCCLRDRYLGHLGGEPATLEVLLLGWIDSDGVLRCYAQCFRRPDGSLAASGKLDPKLLLDDDGRWYKLGY